MKLDFTKELKKIGKRVEKRREDNPNMEPEMNKPAMEEKTEKFCPFMSTLEQKVPCSPHCKLYREQKKGYNCPFPEIFSVSYKLGHGVPKK